MIYFEVVIVLIICEILILGGDIRRQLSKKDNIVFFYRMLEGVLSVYVFIYNKNEVFFSIIVIIVFAVVVYKKLTKLDSLYVVLSPSIYFSIREYSFGDNLFFIYFLIVAVPVLLFYLIFKPLKAIKR